MKIWIDLRFASDDNLYSLFWLEIVKELIKSRKYNLVLYTNEKLDLSLPNCEVKVVSENPWSIKENFTLKKKFEQENFDLMIFFNEYNPITYKKNYIVILPSLKKLFFGPFKNSLCKHYYLKLLTSNLKNAKKIICFDKQTFTDLNERLNIEEWKIEIIKWFFPIKIEKSNEKIQLLDIKNKHNLKNDYIIYDAKEARTKNLERVLLALKKMKDEWNILSLFILSTEACQNLEFRKIVLDLGISDIVNFIWEVDPKEKESYYKQSLWIIYPSIYETFPFELNTALSYDIPIISSNMESIKNILWSNIEYFNALSNPDTSKALNLFLKKKKNQDYTEILNQNSSQDYVSELNKIINEKNQNS